LEYFVDKVDIGSYLNEHDDRIYKLDNLKDTFKVVTLEEGNFWLITQEEDLWVDVILMEHFQTNTDGSGLDVNLIFQSSGPSGSLR